MKTLTRPHSLALLAAALLAGGAFAQTTTTTTQTTATPGVTTHTTTTRERIEKTGQSAGRIASQPVTDVGAKKTVVPPVLQRAIAAPYGSAGTASCAQIRSGLGQLNAVLGPDFAAGASYNEDRASKIAEAGGKTIVNSIIPFRGLVREISGAAPAQRRLNAAIDAGYARRGYLRGMARAKGCKLG
jgi:hypothetical protein